MIELIEVKNQGYKITFDDDVINLHDYRSRTPMYSQEYDSKKAYSELSKIIRTRNALLEGLAPLIKIYKIGKGYQGKPIIESLDRYAYVSNSKTLTVMQSTDTENVLMEAQKITNKAHTKKYKVDMPYICPFKPKPVQKEYIDAAMKMYKNTNRLVIEEDPGGGKTFMATKILSKIGERYLVLVKGGYVDKWIEDIKELHGIDPFVIKGKASFKKLTKLDKNELPLIYILSTNTLDSFNRQFRKGVNYLEGFIDDPSELLPFLQCNIILNDESHQYFSSTIEAFLQLDPRLIIALSGTYSSSQLYREHAMQQFFPEDKRLRFGQYDRYMEHLEYTATITQEERVLASLSTAAYAGNRGYSHNALEQRLIQFRNLAELDIEHYKFMLNTYLFNNVNYREGHKAVIFVASIAYATSLTKALAKHYDNVKRFVQDDPYDNIINGTIIVTSIQKAGTAIDIKKLLTLIMSDPVSNKEGLMQASARLRKEYFDNEDIPYLKTFITKYFNGLAKGDTHKFLVNRVLKHKFVKQTIITDGITLPFDSV